MLFVAIVRPHLEFGNVVWFPRYEKDKKLIEGVQRRATKIIPGLKDLSYEERLEKMKLPSLCYRRLRGDLIEAYKYTHGVYELTDELFELETRTNTRGHEFKLRKQRCNSGLRQHFFTQRVTDQWNNLPDDVVQAPSVNAFKNRLDSVMQQFVYRLEVPRTTRSGQKTSSFYEKFQL